MGDVVRLPNRQGFNEQERQRITEVASHAGASVQWLQTRCGTTLACIAANDSTLGTIVREHGMVLWYPRDAVSPFLAHVSLDECLEKLRRVL